MGAILEYERSKEPPSTGSKRHVVGVFVSSYDPSLQHDQYLKAETMWRSTDFTYPICSDLASPFRAASGTCSGEQSDSLLRRA